MRENTKKIVKNLISRYPKLENIEDNLYLAIEELKITYNNGGKILVCGNGGSAADSLHIVGELMKSFVLPRKVKQEYENKFKELFPEDADYFIKNLQEGISSLSLVNEVGLLTAYGNDNAPDLAFAQQVYGHGKKGDILIAISTSGNSKNVIYAMKVAKIKEIKVISLTGRDGGKIKPLSDINLNVDEKETYRIQEYHLPIYHNLCLALENELFSEEE